MIRKMTKLYVYENTQKLMRYIVVDGHFDDWSPEDDLYYDPTNDRVTTGVCYDEPTYHITKWLKQLNFIYDHELKMSHIKLEDIEDTQTWSDRPFLCITDHGKLDSILLIILILLNDTKTILRAGCIHTSKSLNEIKECLIKIDRLCE